jgi:hypothetical protein
MQAWTFGRIEGRAELESRQGSACGPVLAETSFPTMPSKLSRYAYRNHDVPRLGDVLVQSQAELGEAALRCSIGPGQVLAV